MKNIVRCFFTAVLAGVLVISLGLFASPNQFNPSSFSQMQWLGGFINSPAMELFGGLWALETGDPAQPPLELLGAAVSEVPDPPKNGDNHNFRNNVPETDVNDTTVDNAISKEQSQLSGKTGSESTQAPERNTVENESSLPKPVKTAYLTFDDGPSEAVTLQILDTLKEHQIKATFFVMGSRVESHPWIVQRALAEGHGIGNHTYTHHYQKVYASPEAFLNEVNQCANVLDSVIGFTPRIFRAPGGSNFKMTSTYAERLWADNYQYYDWNVCPGDAMPIAKSARTLIDNTLRQAHGKNRIIVLLHDASNMRSTAEALPEIIKGLRDMGFTFAVITPETNPIQFKLKNS